MPKYFLIKSINHLLLALAFFTSCKGQIQANQPKDVVIEPKTNNSAEQGITKLPSTNPNANVHCSLQDKTGKIWFGTTGQGIYCYDVKYFTNFTVKDGLNSNNIYAVLEDKRGELWFGTDVGLSRFDGKKFTNIPNALIEGKNFFPYNSTSVDQSKKNTVNYIIQDKKGKIWLGTYNGVYCYDGKNFTHFLYNDNVENKSNLTLKATTSILEDKNGNIWFSTWFEGLCRYDGKSITSFKPNGEVWFSHLLEDSKGNIWAGRRTKGIIRYNGENFSNVLQNGIFDSCGVDYIAEDKAGNIWIATEFGELTGRESKGGLWRFDGKNFTNYTMSDGLPNNAVFSITLDKSGKLWAGTRKMGLCCFDGKVFTSFSE